MSPNDSETFPGLLMHLLFCSAPFFFFFNFTEHVFRWPSLSQFPLPTAPLGPASQRARLRPGLLPTCLRPSPCAPARGPPGRLRPGTGWGERPGADSCRPAEPRFVTPTELSPLKSPLPNQPSLPGEVLILVAFLPFILRRVGGWHRSELEAGPSAASEVAALPR